MNFVRCTTKGTTMDPEERHALVNLQHVVSIIDTGTGFYELATDNKYDYTRFKISKLELDQILAKHEAVLFK